MYHNEGIWELKSTMDLFWREQWSADYHVKRYSTIIERAVKNRSVCVLWFHPSFSPEFLHHVLPGIFRFIYEKQDQVKVLTTGDYIRFLNDGILLRH